MVELMIAVVALLVGAAIGWWLATSRAGSVDEAARAQAQAELAQARADAAQAREAVARVQHLQATQLVGDAEAKQRVADADRRAAEAHAASAEVQSQLSAALAQRDAAIERARELANDRASMLDQFKVMSSETLDKHGKAADASADKRLQATQQLMTPVAEALQLMNQRLTDVEKSREAMSAELREQVRTIVATNETLRRETQTLSTALRTPQVRGAWGEQSLKRIVEMSGLVERCDFFQQTSTRTDDGLFRPDLTVRLAGDKVVFVDSKAPLTALLDAYGTDDLAAQAEHLKRFGKLVRSHVDDLSKKNYWSLDAGSPEFVVMFLPSEEIFHAALQQQPDLQEYAAGKQIVLASPSILIGLLKTVAHGWQQARLAESAAEVQKLGRELYDRLATMGDHFEGVGRGLSQALKAYNSTIGSLESRVLVTARKFNDLEVTRADLKTLKGVSEAPREITAPDLLSAMGEAERAELTRPEPAVDELISSTTPLIPIRRDGTKG